MVEIDEKKIVYCKFGENVMEFEPGQKIICINSNNSGNGKSLSLKKVYTFKKCDRFIPTEIQVEEIKYLTFKRSRFIPAEFVETKLYKILSE